MTSFFKSKMPLVYFVTSLWSWRVWLGVVEFSAFFVIVRLGYIPYRPVSCYDDDLERAFNYKGMRYRKNAYLWLAASAYFEFEVVV